MAREVHSFPACSSAYVSSGKALSAFDKPASTRIDSGQITAHTWKKESPGQVRNLAWRD